MSTQPTLFDEPISYVLWHKPPAKYSRWRIVGSAPTQLGAVSLMSGSGEYLIRCDGTKPTDEPTRDQSRPVLELSEQAHTPEAT